ncbi:uncharacterized protein EV420DRAFT_251226 [Desarmillaria tabescens]|uniref:F-box domain-containing protein n=1 Tax=Armillaria tabescens TaxID=1929756 RepID=A0AA39KG07_ARMTA|nr:uncharacterized protein EV420DRAFT_251226 [Desarmillaria tabescens]KAK0460103.1 hypothetical protein EV420DRAFT_251226 [Desarmillaria tabescens]
MPQGLCASCGAASLRYNEVQPPRSPRIQHLLSINEPPLEGEQAALRATVFKGSSVLSDLDATISDVRAVLDALLRDRAQATANIRDATVILHPIRRLPEDILRTIFSSCVPPQKDYLYNLDTGAPPCLGARNPRWTLSQTCRRWRYVALTTSNLWSCIDLDFNLLIRVQRMTVAFKLGLNVERSRSRDLTIRIRSQWDIVDHPALAVLLTCVRRWKNVDIDMPANSFRGLSVCRGLLYSLRYLRLRFHGDPSNPDTLDAFEFAPNLSFLSSGPDFNLQHVPWSQITVYSTWGVNMHCVDVLKKMSNLKSLRVYCGKDALSETPVRLGNLETLTLVDQRMQGQPSAARISECFNTLSTPALKKLVIVHTDLRPWSFPSALPCHLTTLEVVGHLTADHASFVGFLSAIPTLRHLVLRVIGLNGSLLSVLVLRGNENVIAPFLSILDLRLSRWHSNTRSELLGCLDGVTTAEWRTLGVSWKVMVLLDRIQD